MTVRSSAYHEDSCYDYPDNLFRVYDDLDLGIDIGVQ